VSAPAGSTDPFEDADAIPRLQLKAASSDFNEWRNIAIALINHWTKARRRVGWLPHYRCASQNHRVPDVLVSQIGVAILDLAQRNGHKHYTDQ
jgi:hypothetical protein